MTSQSDHFPCSFTWVDFFFFWAFTTSSTSLSGVFHESGKREKISTLSKEKKKEKGTKSDKCELVLSIYIGISEQLVQQKFNITHSY